MQSDTSKTVTPITTLLFDFGGTLGFLDYPRLAAEFSSLGHRFDAGQLERAEYQGRRALDRHLMGPHRRGPEEGARVYFSGWFEAAGIPAAELARYRDRFDALNRAAAMWSVIKPGTAETLARLKSAGLKLGIVSNADGRVAENVRGFGLGEFFDAVIDSQVVGVSKPSPRIFKIALERLGARPEQTRHVGDIYSIDIVGARAAGIEARLVDALDCYGWVEHEKIHTLSEFFPLA